MTTLAEPQLMTTDQLLALPDDGVERELIRGQLRERPMTRRSYRHSRAEATVAKVLGQWLSQQPEPRGQVLSGEAGFRIRQNPDTAVGIDVAYISAETARAHPEDVPFIDGVPVLAVEILSPSDKQEDILDKVRDYLAAGVPLVWVLEPVFRTVCVYRPSAQPVLFNADQEIAAEPRLPGLRVRVAELFAA